MNYTIPDMKGGRFKDFLWITFIAREFKSQSGLARGNSSLGLGKDLGS